MTLIIRLPEVVTFILLWCYFVQLFINTLCVVILSFQICVGAKKLNLNSFIFPDAIHGSKYLLILNFLCIVFRPETLQSMLLFLLI